LTKKKKKLFSMLKMGIAGCRNTWL
jgi:hypothetical protein